MRTYRLQAPAPAGHIDYRAELNEQQHEVVMAGGGARLVIAGAGSGKTRTLTYRVARLLEQGVAADRIALCTFTNKAAHEMLSRVEHLVAGEARRVAGGTFHHLANRLLRERSAAVGLSQDYSILDQEDARDLLGDCLSAVTGMRRRRQLAIQPNVLLGLIGLAVNTITPLQQVVLERAPGLVAKLDDLLAAARAYRDRKLQMNAVDFDDLLWLFDQLLAEQPQGAALAELFDHVLVDEYQDTSPLQADLVDRLATGSGNLTVVGDDAQSIYGFRGADPSNVLTFAERWPEMQLHKLEINYRSSPQILELANATIAHNRDQVPKTLRPTRPTAERPALVPLRDGDMEAAFVAQRVLELSDEGLDLDEMAVLYRAHHHSMQLQVELTRRGIPYRVRSGVRFFEQAHIKDVLAHLRAVLNPREELSWLRLLRLQPGIGRTGAARIWQQLSRHQDPLRAALALEPEAVAARNRPGWHRVRRLLDQLTSEPTRDQAGLAIQAVLDGGYAELLPGLYRDADSRRDDIVQLAAYADRFNDPRSLLAELNLLASFASETVLEPGETETLLTLSSVHQAKGLEWRVVFVLALNEGAFPHPRAVREQGGLEEERRLFYVAVTRCQQQLYLLSRQVEDRPHQRRTLLKPSRFLDEVAGGSLFERWQIETGD